MDYLSTQETAMRWGISQRRVIYLAQEGRIPGAKQFGINWMIPHDAEKPVDGRTKAGHLVKNRDTPFRFPLYVNFGEQEFSPPLSKEELLLRNAQKHLYACRFDEARNILNVLVNSTQSHVIRIASLYHLISLTAYDLNVEDYNHYFIALYDELNKKDPHAKDLQLFQFMLSIDSGYNFKNILESFHISSQESYHPSTYNVLACLSFVALSNGDYSLLSNLRFDSYELLCMQMEQGGHFIEAQALHLLLLSVYTSQHNEEMMIHHARSAIKIGFEQEFYLLLTMRYYYYSIPALQKILQEFPKEFAENIQRLGHTFRIKFKRFSFLLNHVPYVSLLSEEEILLARLVIHGYSNNAISKRIQLSEKTVVRRLHTIYQKLQVSGRKELIFLMNSTHAEGKMLTND